MPAPAGDRVVPVINRLMDAFDVAVASKDWHPDSTVHFDTWPRHCIQGTWGAELHPDLRQDRIGLFALKGTRDSDEGYSAFEATNIDLEGYLKDRGVDSLYLTGIAAEYCVKASALDAVRRGFAAYVIKDAVAAVELKQGDADRAFQEMQQAGVKVVLSSEVPSGSL